MANYDPIRLQPGAARGRLFDEKGMTSQLPDPLPTQILTFRCPAELEGVLPPPVPACQTG